MVTFFSGSPLTYLFTLCHPLVHGSKEAGEVWKYMWERGKEMGWEWGCQMEERKTVGEKIGGKREMGTAKVKRGREEEKEGKGWGRGLTTHNKMPLELGVDTWVSFQKITGYYRVNTLISQNFQTGAVVFKCISGYDSVHNTPIPYSVRGFHSAGRDVRHWLRLNYSTASNLVLFPSPTHLFITYCKRWKGGWGLGMRLHLPIPSKSV